MELLAPEYASNISSELLAVLEKRGYEAGQYNVLGPDPWRIIWNDDRSGFISFLEAKKCLVTWRSPVACDEQHRVLLERLASYASQTKRELFILEANEASRAAGLELGMTSIWTGSESYLDLATWSLEGTKRANIRWSKNRAIKDGLDWREAFPATNVMDKRGIHHVEEWWKAERTERRTDSFLRTDFEELMSLRRYFVCEKLGEIIAFVTCTPVNADGWYLQDIVRTPDASRGALEGAMAYALDIFQKEGFAFVSNGPLPFWEPSVDWSDPHQFGFFGNHVLRFFNRQYRFKGISQFRSKFEPDWTRSLYVLRSQRFITPGVGLSLIKLLKRKLS